MTGAPRDSSSGIALGLHFTFRLHLLWKYPSGVYWPMDSVNWQANFHAVAVPRNPPTGPIDMIANPHGVTADPGYISAHNPPEMSLTVDSYWTF